MGWRAIPTTIRLVGRMGNAIAKMKDKPLLFQGEDFKRTDITPAL